MDSMQINIDNKLYGVTSYEQFSKHTELYNNYFTAVSMDFSKAGIGIIALPVRSPLENKPGVYKHGPFFEYVLPEKEDTQYSSENIVDLKNSTSMAEFLDKQTQVRDIEREMLTSPDSITVPNISSNDQPLMRGMKEAVKAKRIDINKYEDRFGPNFANDKRSLKGNTITIKMFNRVAKNLDMKATLIIEDANPDVPNPIGKKIIVDLLGGDDSESEEE